MDGILGHGVVPRLAKAVVRLAFAAVFAFSATTSANAAEFTVSVRAIPDLKAVFGTVESLHVTPARSRNGGTIDRLVVQEGDRVEVGQRLATVTDPKLPLQLTALDARIRALMSQQAQATIDLDRMQQLIKSGSVTRASLDAAQTNAAVVGANLAAMQAERAVVAEQLLEGDVLAPANGRVLKILVVNGTVVLPGDTVATIAADAYVLRMRLPERHAKFIHAGDEVLVGARGLDVSPEKLTVGHVRLVYPELDQGEVVADVDVTGLGDYFVGERTRVFVSTGTRRTIVVPESYVYKRFGVAYARLKGIGEIVIQPGLPVEGGIEVLSGLEPGDVLLPPETSP